MNEKLKELEQMCDEVEELLEKAMNKISYFWWNHNEFDDLKKAIRVIYYTRNNVNDIVCEIISDNAESDER